jgi:hypothetical protein
MKRISIQRLILSSLIVAASVVSGSGQDDRPEKKRKSLPIVESFGPKQSGKVGQVSARIRLRPAEPSPQSAVTVTQSAQGTSRPPAGNGKSNRGPGQGSKQPVTNPTPAAAAAAQEPRRSAPSNRGPVSSPGADAGRNQRDRGGEGRPTGPAAGQGDRDSGRNQPRQSPGNPPARLDSRRPQFGISVGPGGVQIFRGDVQPGPGGRRFNPGYYGRDPWGQGPNLRSGNALQWYPNRGWGIAIDTRPTLVVPSSPVIVSQPQGVPSPQAPANPPVPTEEELAGMPGVQLRGLLLFAAERLHEELGTLSTGDSWRQHLRIADLRRLVPSPALAPPPPDATADIRDPAEPLIAGPARRELADILQVYSRVRPNPEYQQISGLWGFRTTQAALRELLMPPLQRQRKQLTLSVDLLEEELQQFETGPTWAKFLKLSDARRIAARGPQEVTAADRKRLKEIANDFDSVAVEPRYRMISDLMGFQLTQHVAHSYLTQLEPTAPPAPKTAPPAPIR